MRNRQLSTRSLSIPLNIALQLSILLTNTSLISCLLDQKLVLNETLSQSLRVGHRETCLFGVVVSHWTYLAVFIDGL